MSSRPNATPPCFPLPPQGLPKFWLPIIRTLTWVDGPETENQKVVMDLPTEADTDTTYMLESLVMFAKGVAYLVQSAVTLPCKWIPIEPMSISFSFRAISKSRAENRLFTLSLSLFTSG